MAMSFASGDVPETYYRVSVKALIFDANNWLLVFKDKSGEWEMPGGGWEHHETFEACLKRELAEEAHAMVAAIGPVAFCYRTTTASGKPKLCIAAKVTLGSPQLQPDDDLVEARFVTRDELLQLPFQAGEACIKEWADHIWPS